MANDATRVAILDGMFQELNIPVESISVVDINAVPPLVNVLYKIEATSEQILLGNQVAGSFDWRRRRPLGRSTVVTVLRNLTTQQRNDAILHDVADRLRADPQLAAKIASSLGIPLPVDEVDPN